MAQGQTLDSLSRDIMSTGAFRDFYDNVEKHIINYGTGEPEVFDFANALQQV